MAHVFISYVRDDAPVVGYIVKILRANGVEVWLDKDSIDSGARWKESIRKAIKSGGLFFALFSRAWNTRDASYANEELVLAIEELRQRPSDRAWFVPVKIDACEVPDRSIGGGETLRDLQHIDFLDGGWRKSLSKMLTAAGIHDHILDLGEPLGSGLPPSVEFLGGQLVYQTITPPIPQMEGMVIQVTGGWAMRDDEQNILAFITTQSPFVQMQALNQQFGLDSLFVASEDGYVSTDANNPNSFSSTRDFTIPAGSELWVMGSNDAIILPIDIAGHVAWSGKGILVPDSFIGNWQGVIEFGGGTHIPSVEMAGEFHIRVAAVK